MDLLDYLSGDEAEAHADSEESEPYIDSQVEVIEHEDLPANDVPIPRPKLQWNANGREFPDLFLEDAKKHVKSLHTHKCQHASTGSIAYQCKLHADCTHRLRILYSDSKKQLIRPVRLVCQDQQMCPSQL
jgi:hypothetical protein